MKRLDVKSEPFVVAQKLRDRSRRGLLNSSDCRRMENELFPAGRPCCALPYVLPPHRQRHAFPSPPRAIPTWQRGTSTGQTNKLRLPKKLQGGSLGGRQPTSTPMITFDGCAVFEIHGGSWKRQEMSSHTRTCPETIS
ncbi:hypothetical protein JTB14_009059 [Gonioctena quinquepunctata]|nr:hypothetical protein JTB14_009059 [Gonioctena quinquepunctata]